MARIENNSQTDKYLFEKSAKLRKFNSIPLIFEPGQTHLGYI